MKSKLKFLIGSFFLTGSFQLFAEEAAAQINTGDTAWVLSSSTLVLIMTVPALALFYAGMVRKKNVLATIFYSLSSAIIVGLLWVLGLYSLIFTTTSSATAGYRGFFEWFGTLKSAFFFGINANSIHPNAPTIPEFVFSMFQLKFAIITVALISGAIVERIRFASWFMFTILWSIFVYAPLAHWVWNPQGWLWHMGALDFAGGLVVHTSSGVAALVAVFYLGPRVRFRKEGAAPANIGYVFIGASLLWVGWFGFNAGSALAANGLAGSAFLVTNTAAAMAGLTWVVLEWIVMKKPSVIGACTGVVAGLVVITPASGYVDVPSALVFGILISLVSFSFITFLRRKFKYDDSLDVFSVHGIGGILGALLTGVFASPVVNSTIKGGVLTGNWTQLGIQVISVLAAIAISVVGTLLSLFLVDLLTGRRLRVEPQDEIYGLDLSQHGERLES